MINIIIGLLTSAIVQGLKKVKLPSKIAPMVVLVVAVILTAGAKALGFSANVNTIAGALINALGVAGATALVYDQIKALKKK